MKVQLLKTLFVANIIVSAIAFGIWLGWIDTGRWSGDSIQFTAVGGLIFGVVAVMLEIWLYNQRGLWPKNQFLFFLRFVVLSSLWICLSFTLISGLAFSLELLFSGQSIIASLSALVVIPFMIMFYFPLILPLGLCVGLVNSLIVHRLQDFKPDALQFVQ